jgi:hypothetical protein
LQAGRATSVRAARTTAKSAYLFMRLLLSRSV